LDNERLDTATKEIEHESKRDTKVGWTQGSDLISEELDVVCPQAGRLDGIEDPRDRMPRVRHGCLEEILLEDECVSDDVFSINAVLAIVCRRRMIAHPVDHLERFASLGIEDAEPSGARNEH
jgi:hypothetical protein